MTVYAIKKIAAREILDSRGTPTVEAEVHTGSVIGVAMVPSGASTGIFEALELRDNEPRFSGKGVTKAVANINITINKALAGFDVRDQVAMDNAMIALDGTKNKSRLGANAILAVSMAASRAHAAIEDKQLYEVFGTKYILPVPFMNIINGGRHADNDLSFQEFMIVPQARTFRESMRMGCETYQVLKKLIREKYGSNSTNVGDEGGFAPKLSSVRDALLLIRTAIDKAGYAKEVGIAVDAAASEFYADGKYNVDRRTMAPGELLQLYLDLIKEYHIVSIEDAFSQESFEDFAELTKKAGSKTQVVGDDLLVTNPERIAVGIRKKACSCLLLKVNQIGTLTESLAAAKMAMVNKWGVMVSHRSGETEDSFIADLAVGISSGQIKSGAPCRSERLAKYNRLLRIEEQLGSRAKYNKLR